MLKKMISAVSAAVVALGFAVGAQSGAFGLQGTVAGAANTSAQSTYILPTTRISGNNRYDTAVACSKKAFPKGAATVIIASGTGYADALSGSALASSANAPVLLAAPSGLTDTTIKEIQRLKAKNVIILGGKNAVTTEVEFQLTGVRPQDPEPDKDKNDGKNESEQKQTEQKQNEQKQYEQKQSVSAAPKTAKTQTKTTDKKSSILDMKLNVERIQGENRYETALLTAQETQKKLKKTPDTLFFVSGSVFPDALSIAPISGMLNASILYVDKSGKLDAKTVEYLKLSKGKVKKAYVIGGANVIGNAVFNQLKPYIPSCTRICGKDRYDTNLKVIKAFEKQFSGKDIYIAAGKSYPDALAGSMNAKLSKTPLMLVGDTFTDQQKNYIKQRSTQDLKILGGEATVNEGTVTSLFSFVEPQFTMLNFGDMISLTWQEVRSASAYELYRNGKLIKRITDLSITSYTDTGLKASRDYNYMLRFVYKSKSKNIHNRDFTQSSSEYHAVLNSVTHSPRSTMVTENAQPARSTYSSYNIMLLKTGDWATLDKFAKTHFTKDMTNADKVAYTLKWINRNVWYGTVQDGGWAILLQMCRNGTFSYVNCIFNKKIGQCNCYNGALVSMMLYLGYDAHLVMGHRGVANSRGAIVSRWQHFWGEVVINGQTYVMEAGNYGEDGDWMYICQRYRNVDTPTKGYIKNHRVMMT